MTAVPARKRRALLMFDVQVASPPHVLESRLPPRRLAASAPLNGRRHAVSPVALFESQTERAMGAARALPEVPASIGSSCLWARR
jgi:hypothetical protein